MVNGPLPSIGDRAGNAAANNESTRVTAPLRFHPYIAESGIRLVCSNFR